MRLRAEQLSSHLSQGPMAPVYLVSGDEALLVQEAADAIRAAAKSQNYTERELLHVEAGFDWDVVLTEANSLSLFSEKKILEIRIPNGKPGDKASKTLQAYINTPNPDTLMLIITPKLESATTKSKSVKAIDSQGVFIQLVAIAQNQLPHWINQRLPQAGIQASRHPAPILPRSREGELLPALPGN